MWHHQGQESKDMADRKLATIRTVSSVEPIEGADFIELAHVDGWQCVVKKGEFRPGDLCVYFEVDSFLPVEERYEFLRKSSYVKLQLPIDGLDEGFRLKTVRLKKTLSQGLALPLHAFSEHPNLFVCDDGLLGDGGILYTVGADVSALLGVVKYETALPPALRGLAKGLFPSFIRKTDEERIQNLPHYFDKFRDMEFEVTEKVDGMSMTVYLNDGVAGVCSRNIDLKLSDGETSVMWGVAQELALHQILKDIGRNLALQGELAGEGIQGNPLKLRGRKFFLFNIWDIDKQAYLTPGERGNLFNFIMLRSDIQHVPALRAGFQVFREYGTMRELLHYATGNSLVNMSSPREGLVFKSIDKVDGQVVSFKAISNDYLLRNRT